MEWFYALDFYIGLNCDLAVGFMLHLFADSMYAYMTNCTLNNTKKKKSITRLIFGY